MHSTFRVLVVDDFEPFRQFICQALQEIAQLTVVCEASDGLEAVQKARDLQPELILLDLGLPKLDGLEAARRIREFSPESKILFVSEHLSIPLVQRALDIGAMGYITKSEAARDLLAAVQVVLKGEVFASPRLAARVFAKTAKSDQMVDDTAVVTPSRTNGQHVIGVYPNDTSLVQGFSNCVQDALKRGNAAILIATESHRASVARRLIADGLNVAAAIEQGSYVPVDAAEMLATFVVGNQPDPVRFEEVAADFITMSSIGTQGENCRVSACGECAPTLLAQGKTEAAIQLEHLWDEVVARRYGADILCGYLSDAFQDTEQFGILERICAEHKAVHKY